MKINVQFATDIGSADDMIGQSDVLQRTLNEKRTKGNDLKMNWNDEVEI